jgi:hypothetical protein
MQANIKAADYLNDVLMADALIGVLASGCVIVVALPLGGFSFFEPWMIATPVMFLTAGVVRARSEGNIWLKSAVISLGSLVFAAIFGNVPTLCIAMPFLILPCACGIWIRRKRPVIVRNE